jgi:hypothetical protein
MEEYLSVGLAATDRKKKILELLQQGPALGLIAVALHEDGRRESSSKFIRPYQLRSGRDHVATIAETVDRYIANAYSRRDRHFEGATITVFDRPHPKANPEDS